MSRRMLYFRFNKMKEVNFAEEKKSSYKYTFEYQKVSLYSNLIFAELNENESVGRSGNFFNAMKHIV